MRFIRVYQQLDIEIIQSNLLIYGDISGNCAKCQDINQKLDFIKCSNCQTEFKYIAFRNIKSHMAKLPRILESRPQLIFIDYEDFSKNLGVIKAEKFLK